MVWMLFLWLLWNPLTGSQASDLGGLVRARRQIGTGVGPCLDRAAHADGLCVFCPPLKDLPPLSGLNRDLTTAWGVPVELRGQDEAGWLKRHSNSWMRFEAGYGMC